MKGLHCTLSYQDLMRGNWGSDLIMLHIYDDFNNI